MFKGYAGVGKTTVVAFLVESLKQANINNIGITATTHKAVKVLRKNAIKGVDYRTIHSMLALKETINDDTGEVTFKQDSSAKEEPPISGLSVLIVDESSMLQDELFNLMVPYIKNGLRVIFVGDPVQIPPVDNRDKNGIVRLDCIPFRNADNPAWNLMVCELTEVMRQKADSPILSFATQIRENFQTNYFTPTQQLNEKSEGIHLIEHNSPEEQNLMYRMFSSAAFKADSDYFKVIAYRRDTVAEYNKRAREILFKRSTLPRILEGEKLIATRPYVVSPKQTIFNNEELDVENVIVKDMNIPYLDVHTGEEYCSLTVYLADVRYYTDFGDRSATVMILHEKSETQYKKVLDMLKEQALEAPGWARGLRWREFYRFRDSMCEVTYNYAVTSHRSQGSTFDHALVLQWDIEAVTKTTREAKNRSLYVACTRPRYNLFIEE